MPYSTTAIGVRKGVLWFVVSSFSRRRPRGTKFASASADGANGSNRKSLAGLDVDKLRGEGTSPLTKSIAQMGQDSRKL